MRLCIIGVSLLLAGCASSSSDIPTQYVSALTYQGYSCQQIAAEADTVSRRVAELSGQVDKRASNDSVKMGVGLVLFWPTLFFLSGDGPQAVEYGRLKGEFEALEKASIQKNCGLTFEQAKPPEPVKEEPKKKDHSSNKKLNDF